MTSASKVLENYCQSQWTILSYDGPLTCVNTRQFCWSTYVVYSLVLTPWALASSSSFLLSHSLFCPQEIYYLKVG